METPLVFINILLPIWIKLVANATSFTSFEDDHSISISELINFLDYLQLLTKLHLVHCFKTLGELDVMPLTAEKSCVMDLIIFIM